jgi:hypothetical protein
MSRCPLAVSILCLASSAGVAMGVESTAAPTKDSYGQGVVALEQGD